MLQDGEGTPALGGNPEVTGIIKTFSNHKERSSAAILSAVGQTEKDEDHGVLLTRGLKSWYKRTYLQTRNTGTGTDTENKLMVTRRQGGR